MKYIAYSAFCWVFAVFVLLMSRDMPKSQNTCVLTELCKWGCVGQSKWRKLQLPYSLRICLLLLPLHVIWSRIPHSTKGKKDTSFIPGEKQDTIPVTCVTGVPSCPESAPLGAAPSNCREARLRQTKCLLWELFWEKCCVEAVSEARLGCDGIYNTGYYWQSCTECKPLGAEVDLSPEDVAVIPGCCSGHRKYYLKCAKSRWRASELWCVEVKM